MKDKLAVITSGGGTKCSFGVGIMLALAEKFGIKEPPILISCSGSAGTGSYFVAKQYNSIRNIWGNLLSTRKFVNRARFWRMIDIDYLIDEIFKKQDPLKADAVYSSPTHYLIPALNRQTGRIDYFSNRSGVDVFEAMRATKAMPLAFRLSPNVVINGSTYCDSVLSSSVETHLEKAVELGAQKVLVVDNSIRSNSKDFEHGIFNLWVSIQDKHFRENYAQAERQARDYRLPRNVRFFSIRPNEPLKIRTLDNNKTLLNDSIQQGYDETSSSRELAEFLK